MTSANEVNAFNDANEVVEFRAMADQQSQGVEPKAVPRRNRGTPEQVHNFTMRLHRDDVEKFIRFCEHKRLSYREGFALLLERMREAHSRDAQERIYKNDLSEEPTVPLSIRPPLSVANRFVAYCKANRLAYWEGLSELMDKAKV
ncbi:hypothetical protein [Microvirga massiliensis]|uniref:hypothetical protein n=1 Tax=Microvirga massiliensis TaxID=1033741 RepID=UPI000660969D|nr:hypothetical protein [Microvirga massiliensis]